MSTAIDIRELRLGDVKESGTNPRKRFDDASLQELAHSIKQKGLLQPILVRPAGKKFEIVAGARRYRASKLAGLENIPALVRQMSDQDALEAQVIENLQREDVHPLEEAAGFKALLDLGIYDPESLAEKTGKSRAYVARRIRLLSLCKEALKALEQGKLTLGAADLLASLPDAELQTKGVQQIVNYGWSVSSLKNWIAREVLMKISSFPFKTSDETLLPQAGACTTCPKNTANERSLFPEIEGADKGLCTDRGCFIKKMEANVGRVIVELTEKNGKPPVLLSRDWDSKRKDVVPAGDWYVHKGGEVGVVVEARGGWLSNLGEVVEFKRIDRRSSATSQADANRKQRIERHVVTEAFARTVASTETPVAPETVRLLAPLVWDSTHFDSQKWAFKAMGWEPEKPSSVRTEDFEKRIADLPAETVLRALFAVTFADKCTYCYQAEQNETIVRLAKAAGVDLKAIRKEAEAKFAPKEPKAKKGAKK